jgi:hypothetical protein
VIAALLAEGSSDRALLPILSWLLAQIPNTDMRVEWVDATMFPAQTSTLAQKITAARLISPCDLLFVHRDSDAQPTDWRYAEIQKAIGSNLVHVAVVPVRTTEAWLMFDAPMIRAAAGRPSGKEDLALPSLGKAELEARPKERLHEALRKANGSVGRKAARFHAPTAIHRLANLIEDWSPLRQLAAFQRLETDLRDALKRLGDTSRL